MFLGSHAITMDAKGRLAIPAKIRDALVSDCEGRLVITAHTEERCLLVYPEPQWKELLPQIEALPNIYKKARLAQRLLLGYATPSELDGNSRVLLPPTLRNYAGLEKKLLLIGQGKKLELWSESAWYEMLASADNGDEMPAEMLSLSL